MLIKRLPVILTIIVVLLTYSGAAIGQQQHELFNFSEPNSHKKLIAESKADSEKRFEQTVRTFQDYLDSHPGDVTAATEMCRFIRYYTFNGPVYHENAERYLQQFEAHLKQQFKNNPIVELYFFDQLHNEEKLSRASDLIESTTIKWTKAQLASIYLELAIFHRKKGDKHKAGKNAIEALKRYPTTTAQLIAGDYLQAANLPEKGIDILTSEYPKEYPNQKKKRMLLLSQLGAHDQALSLLEKLRQHNPQTVTPVEESEIWIRNRSIDKARQVFVSSRWSYWDSERLAKAYFNFEKQYGNSIQALNAYNFLRDQGYTKDPLLFHRLNLAIKHPKLQWEKRDWFGALALLSVFAIALAIPLTFIIPVHYCGLLRQQVGKLNQYWQPGWNLKHAWVACAFFILITQFLISYLFAYEEVFPIKFGETALKPSTLSNLRLAWMVLASDMALIIGLGWILGFGKIWQAYSPAKWSYPMSLVLAILGFVFLRVFAAIITSGWETANAETSLTKQSLQAVHDAYGPFMLMFAVAILTPLIEEILFRGVLLGALAKHIPFWAANLIQASLFTVAHEETQLFPFYFAFGLICGVYRQRSGNLVACTMLHCINNACAAAFLITLN